MANKVIFVNELKHTKEVLVNEILIGSLHIAKFLKRYPNNKQVLEWGDFLYDLKRINEPIYLFNDTIQIVELKQVGHYFICKTSDDKGKTWEVLGGSKSYTDYDECYNAMKKEATEYMANDIDISQDFDFAEENYHTMNVIFGHDYIRISYEGKITLFEMVGDW